MELHNTDYFEIVTREEIVKKTENSLQNQIVAISRSLAKTQIMWTLEQRKLFFMCLSKIAWSKTGNLNVIELKKSEIVENLGLNLSTDKQSYYLREAFRKLAKNSEVHWTDPNDSDVWEDDFLIYGRKSTKGTIKVTFNPKFMPHLENLARDYVTYLTNDIYGFKTSFSYMLFNELRLNCDTRKTNWREYTTKQLKNIFGLSDDDYIRKSDGKFRRYDFEKYVLDKAIEEINQTKMIKILAFDECEAAKKLGGNKFYEKVKEYGYVKKYRFKYIVLTKKNTPNEYDPYED